MTCVFSAVGVAIGQIKLKSPVIAASGTFPEIEAERLLDRKSLKKVGAIVTKTVTLEPRDGNPQPRIAEAPSGIINSIGLENEGVDEFLKIRLKKVLSYRIPVFVSIAGFTVSEFGELARKVGSPKGVVALELNISCPNVKAGGAQLGLDRNAAAEVVSIVKQHTSLPVFVKLPPATHIKEIALSVEKAGVDGVVVSNTLPGFTFLNRRENKYLQGGLSGPAIRPYVMFLVREVVACVKIPVIGCGGVVSGEDVMQYLACGAKAVEVGTATLIDPDAVLRIVDEFEELLRYERRCRR